MTGWVYTPEKDSSFEHCGQPAYWEGEDVYCSKCQELLEDNMDGHICWIDDTLCMNCSGEMWYTDEWGQLHPNVLTRHINWLRRSCRWSMLEALNYLIESASERDHTFCTSDGYPILESSYRPRTGVL